MDKRLLTRSYGLESVAWAPEMCDLLPRMFVMEKRMIVI